MKTSLAILRSRKSERAATSLTGPVFLSGEVIAALEALACINDPAGRSELADALLRKSLNLPALDQAAD